MRFDMGSCVKKCPITIRGVYRIHRKVHANLSMYTLHMCKYECMDVWIYVHACMHACQCMYMGTKWMQYFCTTQVGFMFFLDQNHFLPWFWQ